MRITNTKGMGVDTLKMIVYGESGVGKTTLLATANEPTLIISAEAGLLCLANKDIDVFDISKDDAGNIIPAVKRIERLRDVYNYLVAPETKDKYKWVMIDSLSEIADIVNASAALDHSGDKEKFLRWGAYNEKMTTIIKLFRDLNYNVVFTALSKVEKDETGKRYHGYSMSGSIADRLPQYFDECFYIYVTPEGERKLVCGKTEQTMTKDRSGRLEKIEAADLCYIANKIRGNNNNVEKESLK